MSEPIGKEEYIEMQAEIQRRYAESVGRVLAEIFPSKRVSYVSAALQGITANPHFFGSQFQRSPEAAAKFALECADAMQKLEDETAP